MDCACVLNSCGRRWLRSVRPGLRSADGVRRALRKYRLHVPIPAAVWYVTHLLMFACDHAHCITCCCRSIGYQPQVAGPGPPIQTTESGQGTISVPLCIPGWLVVCSRQSHYPWCILYTYMCCYCASDSCVLRCTCVLVHLSTGPPGCNLFVFHIPNDMTNQDLFNYFGTFGNVISARIMVEKETGRSRGFGTLYCLSLCGCEAVHDSHFNLCATLQDLLATTTPRRLMLPSRA